MIAVFLFLCIVVIVMHFSHEQEEKLSIMYNYTAKVSWRDQKKLFCCDTTTHTTLRRKRRLKGYLSVTR